MEPTRVCLLSCIIIRDKPERRYGSGPKLEMDCQLLLNLSSKLSHSWSLLGTQARPKCKLWIWDRFYMILLTSQSHFPTPAAHLRQEEFQPGDRVRPIENWLGTSTQRLNYSTSFAKFSFQKRFVFLRIQPLWILSSLSRKVQGLYPSVPTSSTPAVWNSGSWPRTAGRWELISLWIEVLKTHSMAALPHWN